MPASVPARSVTEWTFTGDVQALINEIIHAQPELGFSDAKIEERGRGQNKRRDLTIYDDRGRIALSGEVKMPDKPDGRTPYGYGLVEDAHQKADQAGVEYFFTWNVNRLVLWKTFDPRTAIINRDYLYWDVTEILYSSEVENPRVRQQIRNFLGQFLESYSRIYRGEEVVKARPLDERFIHILESALQPIVAQTLFSISALYSSNSRFRSNLDTWMRDEEGWVLSEDEAVIRENLGRAAKFSCYVLVNKLVFYTALRRKFRRLTKLRIAAALTQGSELKELLLHNFREAKEVTHDYETVFDGDFGDDLPFVSDAAVDGWRELLNQIDGFDFTQLDYDIIGHIFERLISPEERHRYGHHYTKTEIVDLINAFCIRTADAHVLDPACGGGTFLVRAYARMRYLSGRQQDHAELLGRLKGLDISAYAAHLSTINLATRQLVDTSNYPLIARSDFFDARPERPVFHIPMGRAGTGQQMTLLQIGHVDAVVGNPPYIRQELLTDTYKKHLASAVEHSFPTVTFSKRSDIFVYFFPHATSFLRGSGSYLGLLTSISWLDTEYGFKLQGFLLNHFRIIAVLESSCEPWFSDARVTSAVTILQLEPDRGLRMNNVVHFVQVRKPLKEFYPANGGSLERMRRADEIRDIIEQTVEETVNEDWRIRAISQSELYRQGSWQNDEEEGLIEDSPEQTVHPEVADDNNPEYRGGKWGLYLRAPDVFFELFNGYKNMFVPLSEIADVRRGLTSGCDDFFFLEDVTDKELNNHAGKADFRQTFGISPSETERIRILRSGDGSLHAIEARYLEPYLHSLMDIQSISVGTNVSKRALLTSAPKAALRNTHALAYIRWGERQGFHERETCAAREPWYDICPPSRGQLIWAKAHQYRHIAAVNSAHLVCNCNLYDVSSRDELSPSLLAAVLNSTIVALSKHQYGRPMGREGNLKTEVVDVKMMLVPDARKINPDVGCRLEASLQSMQERQALPLVEEFELPDRQQLDDAVLQVLGITDSSERIRLRRELYDAMRRMYQEIREAEVRMQVFRQRTARRTRLTPRSVAKDIWDAFDKSDLRTFPIDFVPTASRSELLQLLPGKNIRLIEGLFSKGTLVANGHEYDLKDPHRALFAARILEEGHSGEWAIPNDPSVCSMALANHDKYRKRMNQTFQELAAEHTANEEWLEKILAELWTLHRAAHR